MEAHDYNPIEVIQGELEQSQGEAEDHLRHESTLDDENFGGEGSSEVSLVDEAVDFGDDEMVLGSLNVVGSMLDSGDEAATAVDSSEMVLVEAEKAAAAETALRLQYEQHGIEKWKAAVNDALESRTLESLVLDLQASKPESLNASNAPEVSRLDALAREVREYVSDYYTELPSQHFTRRGRGAAGESRSASKEPKRPTSVEDLRTLLSRGQALEERVILDRSLADWKAIQAHLALVRTWESGVPELLQSLSASAVIRPSALDKLDNALSIGGALGVTLDALDQLRRRRALHDWAVELDHSFKDVQDPSDPATAAKLRKTDLTQVQRLLEAHKDLRPHPDLIGAGRAATVRLLEATRRATLAAQDGLNALLYAPSGAPRAPPPDLADFQRQLSDFQRDGCWFPLRDTARAVLHALEWLQACEACARGLFGCGPLPAPRSNTLAQLDVPPPADLASALAELDAVAASADKFALAKAPALARRFPLLPAALENTRRLAVVAGILRQQEAEPGAAGVRLALRQYMVLLARSSPAYGARTAALVPERARAAQTLREWREGVVGRCVRVDWDGEWYLAKVIQFSRDKGIHGILYEDGSPETLEICPGGCAFSPDGSDSVRWEPSEAVLVLTSKEEEEAKKTLLAQEPTQLPDISSEEDVPLEPLLKPTPAQNTAGTRKKVSGTAQKKVSGTAQKKASRTRKNALEKNTPGTRQNKTSGTRKNAPKPGRTQSTPATQNKTNRKRPSPAPLDVLHEFIEIAGENVAEWNLARVFKYDKAAGLHWVAFPSGTVELLHLDHQGLARSPSGLLVPWRPTRRAFDLDSDYTSGSESDGPSDTLPPPSQGRLRLLPAQAKAALQHAREARAQRRGEDTARAGKKKARTAQPAPDPLALEAAPIPSKPSRPRVSFKEQEASLSLMSWCERRFDDLLVACRDRIIRSVVKHKVRGPASPPPTAAPEARSRRAAPANPVRARVKVAFVDMLEKSTKAYLPAERGSAKAGAEQSNGEGAAPSTPESPRNTAADGPRGGSGFEFVARDLEAALHSVHPFANGSGTAQERENKRLYVAQSRSLCFNLEGNPSLRRRFLLGELDSLALCRMRPQEMANDEVKTKRQHGRQELSQDKIIRLGPPPTQKKPLKREPVAIQSSVRRLPPQPVAAPSAPDVESLPDDEELEDLPAVGAFEGEDELPEDEELEDLPAVGAFEGEGELPEDEEPEDLPAVGGWQGRFRGLPNIAADVEMKVVPGSRVLGGRVQKAVDERYLLPRLPKVVDLRGKIRYPRATKFLEEAGIAGSRRQLVVANIRALGDQSGAQLKQYADELVKNQRAGVIDESKILIYLYAIGTAPPMIEKYAEPTSSLTACIVVKPADLEGLHLLPKLN